MESVLYKFSVLYGRCFGQSLNRMMFFKIFSAGCPSFSYMAKKKKGDMTPIISSTEAVFPMVPLVRK